MILRGPSIFRQASTLRKVSMIAVTGTALGLGYLSSQSTLIHPLPLNDPIFSSASYQRLNPQRNPVNDDVVIKEILLSRIRPELLEKEGDLALEFCRGVWSSRIGFSLLRTYWRLRWYGPDTSTQLWTPSDLSTSNYETGTELVNHFNVVDKTADEILVRFGDSPHVSGGRPVDGLFAIGAKIDRPAGVARLHLKTLVFQSEGTTAKKIAPLPADVVHWWVARLWMVTGSNRLLK